MKHVTHNPDELRKVAEDFVRSLAPRSEATVVALYGNFGAGKTTFAQCVGDILGVRGPIQSPTFVIEKIYELYRQPWQHLIHIDAYRLEKPEELVHLGWKEIVSKPENLILVEWAERVEAILPEGTLRIYLTHGKDEKGDTREISTP